METCRGLKVTIQCSCLKMKNQKRQWFDSSVLPEDIFGAVYSRDFVITYVEQSVEIVPTEPVI